MKFKMWTVNPYLRSIIGSGLLVCCWFFSVENHFALFQLLLLVAVDVNRKNQELLPEGQVTNTVPAGAQQAVGGSQAIPAVGSLQLSSTLN